MRGSNNINILDIIVNKARLYFVLKPSLSGEWGFPSEGLGSGCQPPLVLQMTLHAFKDDAIDQVAESNDQDHDGDDGAHIVQVTAHHQNLAEAQTQIKHFGGDQPAPRNSPPLPETGNNE